MNLKDRMTSDRDKSPTSENKEKIKALLLENADLKAAVVKYRQEIDKLAMQIDKSSVQKVEKAKDEVNYANYKRYEAEQEMKKAYSLLKNRTFLYLGLLATTLLIISFKSKIFISEIVQFFIKLITYLHQSGMTYITWFIRPSYHRGNETINFAPGWVWSLRIVTALIILSFIIGIMYGIFFVVRWYIKRWCTLSLKVCVVSYSIITVWGEKINTFIPINLMALFLGLQLLYLIVLWYLDGVFKSRGNEEHWDMIQNR